jgi:catechol 2,3-dioxygenase-like lactoylglutathione lyase family enzyme
MQVECVDFVSVPTRDAARAMAWYRDVLGIPENELGHSELETPNLTLAFWNPEDDGEVFQPTVAGIAFRVADVESAVEQVRASEAEVVGIVDTGVCHTGFVKDLDGNTVILHRRYAPRGQG